MATTASMYRLSTSGRSSRSTLMFTKCSFINAAGELPFFGRWDIWVKKGGHALGYGLLGLSYFYALPPRLSSGYRWWMAWLLAVGVALSDEFHQSFVEGRGSTLLDVGMDSFGAGLSLLLGAAFSSNSDSSGPS